MDFEIHSNFRQYVHSIPYYPQEYACRSPSNPTAWVDHRLGTQKATRISRRFNLSILDTPTNDGRCRPDPHPGSSIGFEKYFKISFSSSILFNVKTCILPVNMIARDSMQTPSRIRISTSEEEGEGKRDFRMCSIVSH
eukprot:454088-Amorphochlora_amoeboformis.AAC.2